MTTPKPADDADLTRNQPTPDNSKEATAPKDGVSDAVKQAFLEDQKEKQKK